MTRHFGWIVLLLGIAAFGMAARATVPYTVSYQGLLLDDQGDPVQGPVDITFRLYDGLGSPNLVWSEDHTSVPVLDGIYDVTLGETTPLTPGLFAGGSVFMEIEVDGETLVPRQQLLSVPFAVRADTAETSLDVGGVASGYLNQLFTHVPFDGADPPNQDPSEGLADPDGDGRANFVDDDNDDDGIPDASEIAAGSDINLVTPRILDITPDILDASVTTHVVVEGAFFESGMSVVFGSESPTPQNLSSISFEVDVGPQTAGTVDVTVTRTNGQSHTSSAEFVQLLPSISSVFPSAARADLSTTLTIQGTGFTTPGLQVSVGSENPTPTNLTATSFQVTVGPQAIGPATITISYPSGHLDTAGFEFLDPANTRLVFVTSVDFTGNLGGLAGADAQCAALASAASLPGTFLAWLSDGVQPPATRFTPGTTYLRRDGVVVADDFADLTDGSLDAPIRVDENGATRLVSVWTGANFNGTSATPHCTNWTNGSSGTGVIGLSQSVTGFWTNNGLQACDTTRALYCFEQ